MVKSPEYHLIVEKSEMDHSYPSYVLDAQKTPVFVATISAQVCKLMLVCILIINFTVFVGYDNTVLIVF